MGPAALLGSAVTLGRVLAFLPGRLEDQVGDGNEGAFLGCRSGCVPVCLTEPPQA